MNKLINLFSIVFLLFSSVVNAGYNGWQRGRGGRGPERPHGPSHGYGRGHGPGRIEHPVYLQLGPKPDRGWHGDLYYWGGHNYFVWSWNREAPFFGWAYYYGWHTGLYYYVTNGLLCYADNPQVNGLWEGNQIYYSSEDAVNSALGYCENDPVVQYEHAEGNCRIRNCNRWY